MSEQYLRIHASKRHHPKLPPSQARNVSPIAYRSDPRQCLLPLSSLLLSRFFRTLPNPTHEPLHLVAQHHLQLHILRRLFRLLHLPSRFRTQQKRRYRPHQLSQYLACELRSHLAVITRLYNDYAFIARDAAGSDPNSVNFRKFHCA